MKLTVRAILTCLVCLMIVPAVLAKGRHVQRPVSMTGVYENFKVGEGSGDLEGMRVVIISAGDALHAIVQIAQGGAEDPKPEFVAVKVKGMSIAFTVGEQKFTGTVTEAGLRIKDGDGNAQLLKRKPCSSYL